MAKPQHIQWLREGVDSWNTRRSQAKLPNDPGFIFPDFRGTDLFSELRGSGYKETLGFLSVKGFFLDDINLEHGRFQNTQLQHFSFRRANLKQAEFKGASLWGSDLSDAKLNGADLNSADLLGVDLRGAELIRANLTRAILHGAKLEGANLQNATLSDTDFTNTQPWTSILFPDPKDLVKTPHNLPKEIGKIGDLAHIRQSLEDPYKNSWEGTSFNNGYMFYFRGEGDDSWELRPYIMRKEKAILRDKEGEMLLDLMSKRPEDFIGATSALSQWVIAQHHGLKTRLLDITRNPLVALFHACEHPSDSSGDVLAVDGTFHVFVVPKDIVKTFESDAVSVVANLAKLPRSEQDRLMGTSLAPDKNALKEPFDRTNKYFRTMRRLYHYIRQEKPHFKEQIDIRDLFRIFVVEPQQSFERIRVQSGALLLSAFHERFETEEVLKLNKNTPIYHHYKLTVPADKKDEIADELKFLNMTREVLFPGLDTAAEAIVKRYEEHNSRKTE